MGFGKLEVGVEDEALGWRHSSGSKRGPPILGKIRNGSVLIRKYS